MQQYCSGGLWILIRHPTLILSDVETVRMEDLGRNSQESKEIYFLEYKNGSKRKKRRMWQSVGLTVLVIVATLICVLLFMLFGWYVVWQLFLSKFKFLRELVGDTGSPQAETEPSESESERSSPPTPRHRPKTARQRTIPPDSTT
ncbi:hypothetical protein cypCar_00044603 [Cyprinus carpio]|nr:hypothetical protein cypCar_00044603 [Cyprinus carpio]